MKKLFLFVLVLALLCASAVAEGIDWASMTDEELTAAIEAAQAELNSRKPVDDSGESIVIKDGTVLFDYEGVTVVVDGDPELTDYGDLQIIKFNAITTNDTDDAMSVNIYDCSVNGWAVSGFGAGEVPAHKKSRDEWEIFATDAAPHSLEDVEECLMSFRLSDSHYDILYQTEESNYSFGE